MLDDVTPGQRPARLRLEMDSNESRLPTRGARWDGKPANHALHEVAIGPPDEGRFRLVDVMPGTDVTVRVADNVLAGELTVRAPAGGVAHAELRVRRGGTVVLRSARPLPAAAEVWCRLRGAGGAWRPWRGRARSAHGSELARVALVPGVASWEVRARMDGGVLGAEAVHTSAGEVRVRPGETVVVTLEL